MGNPRDAAVGDYQGLIQSIIDNSSTDPLKNPWNYWTKALSEQDVGNRLYGNQSRTMGDVGRNAGAQAAAYGVTNPYAWIQHAQAGVSNQYANQFADLPFKVSQQNLLSNQANFENLYRLLALKGQAAGQRSGGPGFNLGWDAKNGLSVGGSF